jgi:hypothetical protein
LDVKSRGETGITECWHFIYLSQKSSIGTAESMALFLALAKNAGNLPFWMEGKKRGVGRREG